VIDRGEGGGGGGWKRLVRGTEGISGLIENGKILQDRGRGLDG